jgi:hypothetical protein
MNEKQELEQVLRVIKESIKYRQKYIGYHLGSVSSLIDMKNYLKEEIKRIKIK